MANILVTGANGFVGSHVVPALLDAGHRVAALVRSDGAGDVVRRRLSAEQRESLDVRLGDVTRPASLSPALDGVDTVVHLVAIPRDWRNGAELRLVNTEGTRNVVEAARTARVRRFIHQSALGVVDDPRLHYASSKAQGEAIVTDSDLDWTVVKPSILWGERDGFFNILAGLVRMSPGIVPMPAGAKSRYQPMWVRDLATIHARVVDDPQAIGRVHELGGPRYWTYREILEEVLRGMHARRLILPLPQPLIRLVAGTAEAVHLPFPVATDQLRQLAFDNVTTLDSVSSQFGFEPRPMAGNLDYLRRKVRDQEPFAS